MKVFFCRSLVICLDWSSSFWSVKLVRTNRIESGIRREFMVLGLLKVFTIEGFHYFFHLRNAWKLIISWWKLQ